MDERSPAQTYALLVGGVLVVAGIVGFFYNSDFTSNKSVHDDAFGIFSVNGWDNVVHIATGALGLLMAGSAARAYALGLGVAYIGLALWGFAIGSGDSILSIVPVNTADNLLHAALGVLGVAAGLAKHRVARAAPA
jgi:uncharacterized protein DUF4383